MAASPPIHYSFGSMQMIEECLWKGFRWDLCQYEHVVERIVEVFANQKNMPQAVFDDHVSNLALWIRKVHYISSETDTNEALLVHFYATNLSVVLQQCSEELPKAIYPFPSSSFGPSFFHK